MSPEAKDDDKTDLRVTLIKAFEIHMDQRQKGKKEDNVNLLC